MEWLLVEEELIINGDKFSVKYDEYTLEICCNTIVLCQQYYVVLLKM